MNKLKVATKESEFDKVREYVNDFLAKGKYTATDKLWIPLLVEELFKLNCEYGLSGSVEMQLMERVTPTDIVVLKMESEGKPYSNFVGMASIPKDSPIGMGITIINHAADNFSYEYKRGKNILTIIRRKRKEGEK